MPKTPPYHFGTLRTVILEQGDTKQRQGGVFEMPVALDWSQMIYFDPKKWAFRELGIHLAQAIQDTGVSREYWVFNPSPWYQNEWQIPEEVRM